MKHLAIVIGLLLSSRLYAGDQGYRWSMEAERCEKDGRPGLNADFLGPCGDAREIVVTQSLMQGVDFTGAWLNDHEIPGAVVEDGIFYAAWLRRMDLTDAKFTNGNFTLALLSDSHAERADFTNSIMDKAHYWYAHAAGAKFDSVHGVQIDFYGYFPKASFKNAILGYAQFTLCNLAGADFSNADLRHSQFQNADLTGASFKGANLTEAYYDECTRLPFSEHEANKRGMIKADRQGTPCRPVPQK